MAEDKQKKGSNKPEDGITSGDPEINHCPSCGGEIDIAGMPPFSKVQCPHCDEAVRVRTTLGNYQILRLLGEGGMSQVFLAEDLALDRQVALKILHQELSRDDALMALFEREAKLTASINHPNVVKVYTVGSDGDYFFIAMELVDNVSLEERIQQQGLLAEREALDLLHDVASGLRTAYQEGLIHRDIKPGNILLTKDGKGKLVDFGLALQQGGDDEVEDLWATPFYVPPEKLDGKPDDFRGDIYSLGATFFHALAGRPPFDANTASLEELREIKSRPISLVHAAAPVTAATARLIDQMMAYKPEVRPKSYDALLTAIENTQSQLPGGSASRARRQDALGGANQGLSWPVKIGISGASLAVVGLLVAMIVGNGGKGKFSDQELPDSFLNQGGDRVLSAGEKAVAARYNEARTLLLEGKSNAAAKAFASLLESGDLKQPTLGWTQYHAGLAVLLNGDSPAKAREHFTAMALSSEFEDSNETMEVQAEFFRKAGVVLRNPLPVLPEEEKALKSESIEPFALLAYGLKNWNLGQFESAVGFLDSFASAEFPNQFSWMEAYRPLVDAYRSDAEKVTKLPKPSIAMSENELTELKAKLEAKEKEFRTRGGARDLVRRRIGRIEPILEAKKALAAAPPVPEPESDPDDPEMTGTGNGETPDEQPSIFLTNGGVAPPKPTLMNDDGTPAGSAAPNAEWTPEAMAEREQFSALIGNAADSLKNYRFAEARESLAAFDAVAPAMVQLKEDFLAALDGASAFQARLIAQLNAGEYEGKLIRKQGVPIDCKVLSADAEKLVVDLMFGPNDLPLAEVSPGWLLSTGRESWLSENPPEANPDDWAEAAWFARQTGLTEEATQLAESLSPVSEAFAERWKRLAELP